MKNLNESEPVRVAAAVTVLVNSIIAVLIGFSIVHWTVEQIALVGGLWNGVVGVYLAFVVREKVAPVAPNVDPDYTPPPA